MNSYRTLLEMVEDATARREAAQAALDSADREWRDVIESAIHDGESPTEIAKLAKVTRARVYQIRDGRR